MRVGRAAAVVLLLGSVAAAACAGEWPWGRDMVETPARHADEGLLAPPAGTLHRDAEVRISRLRSAVALRSPLSPTSELLERGAGLFAIYCTPCHGSQGKGDGTVAPHFQRSPIDLTGSRARAQPDGYIYATIRDGGASMPALGDSLSREERWAVVHFIRSLQR